MKKLSEKDTLDIVGRSEPLIQLDAELDKDISKIIKSSRFLVVGGAGSIGSAVCEEIFKKNPKEIHIIDINENALVELVRNLRTKYKSSALLKTYVIDAGSKSFNMLLESLPRIDYVLNLSAMKHVRSERDPYTLMRMIYTNVIYPYENLKLFERFNIPNYFVVSSDKASNPQNLMGASKKMMEICLSNINTNIKISSSRFANVAFSNGSLPASFISKFSNLQPFSAPNDVKRYFITKEEAGKLCLISALIGNNHDILFPSPESDFNPVSFVDIARNYLLFYGYEMKEVGSEDEARDNFHSLHKKNIWPCYSFKSDTTGEKDLEEFYELDEIQENLDIKNLSKVSMSKNFGINNGIEFMNDIKSIYASNNWNKKNIVEVFFKHIPSLNYKDLNKYLDDKM